MTTVCYQPKYTAVYVGTDTVSSVVARDTGTLYTKKDHNIMSLISESSFEEEEEHVTAVHNRVCIN